MVRGHSGGRGIPLPVWGANSTGPGRLLDSAEDLRDSIAAALGPAAVAPAMSEWEHACVLAHRQVRHAASKVGSQRCEPAASSAPSRPPGRTAEAGGALVSPVGAGHLRGHQWLKPGGPPATGAPAMPDTAPEDPAKQKCLQAIGQIYLAVGSAGSHWEVEPQDRAWQVLVVR